ncbi:hypothetical protein HYE68_007071 [Fusarium pseudograminearum]|nr:hypothetical protein HYE68_007071 [Fusarium pseudograminearum]
MGKEFELIDSILLDSMSTTSSNMDGTATPTHTVMSETLSDYTESVPYPGAHFIIRQRDTGKVITLVAGDLQLADGLNPKGGYHWECIEKNRWLGFRNCVSGTIIGHNNNKKFVARAEKHQSYEYITLRPNPQGGYELMTKHNHDELWSMNVADDGQQLVETKGQGALWDFLKV